MTWNYDIYDPFRYHTHKKKLNMAENILGLCVYLLIYLLIDWHPEFYSWSLNCLSTIFETYPTDCLHYHFTAEYFYSCFSFLAALNIINFLLPTICYTIILNNIQVEIGVMGYQFTCKMFFPLVGKWNFKFGIHWTNCIVKCFNYKSLLLNTCCWVGTMYEITTKYFVGQQMARHRVRYRIKI